MLSLYLDGLISHEQGGGVVLLSMEMDRFFVVVGFWGLCPEK